MSSGRRRLAILNSHPIQYFAPLYRRLACEPDIDLTVFYCSRQGLEQYQDPGFSTVVRWDVPLLDGYTSIFLSSPADDHGVHGFWSLRDTSVIRKLYRGRYDALWIHGHGYATNIVAIAAARLLGMPVFMRGETHLLLSRSPVRRLARAVLMRVLYRHLVSRCLTIGSRNEAFYRSLGVPASRLVRVPYVVDNDYFAARTESYRGDLPALRASLGLPAEGTIVLYASKLIERKRPLDLLRAFAALRSEMDGIHLVLVGSGPEEGEVRRYIEEHSVTDVHLVGFKNQSELPKFYAAADLFVLPSEDEPWGLIINEVMAAGLPVIASEEIGATVDLVLNGVTGFVYPAGDVGALQDRLRVLCTDEPLRRTMSDAARARIATWDFEACVAGVRTALGLKAQP
jgi:glycosyltransferase involved in cell wall biosynthesis